MTERIEAGRQWKKISDGTQDVVIQFTDGVEIYRSSDCPDEHAVGLKFANTTLTITAPDVVWLRTYGIYRRTQVVVW
ncbi:TPA: hypothetical protein MND73_004302 [Salmonella enterica subsp. houtenae]|nr:hypothetical protein [Salmonella enterica subsp. houtenae]